VVPRSASTKHTVRRDGEKSVTAAYPIARSDDRVRILRTDDRVRILRTTLRPCRADQSVLVLGEERLEAGMVSESTYVGRRIGSRNATQRGALASFTVGNRKRGLEDRTRHPAAVQRRLGVGIAHGGEL
jgi:hypothetical protein